MNDFYCNKPFYIDDWNKLNSIDKKLANEYEERCITQCEGCFFAVATRRKKTKEIINKLQIK